MAAANAAAQPVSVPSEAERNGALDAANRYRQILGLPAFRLDARLSAAAEAHSRYLTIHRVRGHDEIPSLPGFTGATPAERTRAAGYVREAGQAFLSVSEDVGSGRTIADALRDLFDAPYHRQLFSQPGAPDLGVGVTEMGGGLKRVVLNAGGRVYRREVVVYPVDGQRDVPRSWQNDERPDPLRMHTKARFVGYVVTLLNGFGMPGRDDIRVMRAELTTEDGRAVPCYVNTPENDGNLPNGVFLIPQRRLQPGTTYVADVEAVTVRDRENISRRWRFTTVDAPEPLRVLQNVRIRFSGTGSRRTWNLSVLLANSDAEATGPMRLLVTDAEGRAKTTEVDSLEPGERRIVRLSASSRPARVRIVPYHRGAPDERGAQILSLGAP